MILTKEIIDNLPVISDEELEKIFVPTDILTHNALHDFQIGCMEVDKESDEQPEVKAHHTFNGRLTWKDNNLDCIRTDFEKVVYDKYQESFSEQDMERFVNDEFGEMVPVERIRRLMYGYTFTEAYCKDSQEFDIGYCLCLQQEDKAEWRADQIENAILSTGDGRTPETAFDVIDISQEYDLIKCLMPIDTPLVVAHELLPGNIDRLELEENPYGITEMYFDIHRRFEVGY